MIKEISLPRYPALAARVDFEFPHELFHTTVGWERSQRVKVIWHQQQEAAVPVACSMIEFCAIEQTLRHFLET
jgi:hypothetical protein